MDGVAGLVENFMEGFTKHHVGDATRTKEEAGCQDGKQQKEDEGGAAHDGK